MPDHAIHASDIGAPEGPVTLAEGGLYVTEMAGDRLCISHLDAAGGRRVVHTTGGRPNGLAADGDGLLWIAEAGHRAVVCVAPDGREVLRIEGDEEGRFRFPNDLAFGPDGHLYLTDSGLALTEFLDGQTFRTGYLDLGWDGRVYEIDPRAGRVVRRIDRGLRFTNGIAFDARGMLYANASFPGDIYRYDVFGAGGAKRELFANVLQPSGAPGFKGPDGMKFGADGRLYCTVYGQKNVSVVDPSGAVVERLELHGRDPTNCAFAPAGRTLYVTEVGIGHIESLPVPCDGLPLHRPKLGLG